jgi:hypothetical protein
VQNIIANCCIESWIRSQIYGPVQRRAHTFPLQVSLHNRGTVLSSLTTKNFYRIFYILGHNAVKSAESEPTFRRNMSLPYLRTNNKPSMKSAWKHVESRVCSDYYSALKMEATCTSETSMDFQRTRRYIPENRNLHNHHWENLKSYKDFKTGMSTYIHEHAVQRIYIPITSEFLDMS